MSLESTLSEISERAGKAFRGPWEVDSEHIDGEFGDGPDPMTGYKSFYVVDSVGNRVCDSEHADQSIMAEHGTEEDGGSAWDENGRLNLAFIAAARTDVPRLVAALRHEMETSRLLTISANATAREVAEWKTKRDAELARILSGEKGEG